MKLNEPLSCISKSSFWGWLKMLSYSKLFHLILPITRAGRIQVIGNAALYTIAGNILNYLSYEIDNLGEVVESLLWEITDPWLGKKNFRNTSYGFQSVILCLFPVYTKATLLIKTLVPFK